jgi:uncharacterized protein with GYD domain
MAKFLFEAHYTLEGAKGIIKEGGSARRAAIERAVTGLGGRLETFHFAFGSVDAYVIVGLPDNVTTAAMALAVGRCGLASTKTIVLLTMEEADAATKKSVTDLRYGSRSPRPAGRIPVRPYHSRTGQFVQPFRRFHAASQLRPANQPESEPSTSASDCFSSALSRGGEKCRCTEIA